MELKRSGTAKSNDVQALEGKDVKDMLLNVGSGGGAAAAAPSGGAAVAAGGAADAPAEKEEEKEEGAMLCDAPPPYFANVSNREGRVGRRHGFRPLRLSLFTSFLLRTFESPIRTLLGARRWHL